MADSKKVFRLPRHLIAQMAGGNPQSIKALENLEVEVGQTLPEQIEQLQDTIRTLEQSLQDVWAVANQALALAGQKQSDNHITVQVPLE